MSSLDMRVKRPEAMEAYLANNGWHFSKKAYQWAAKRMSKDGKSVKPFEYDEVEDMLKQANIELKNDNGYDKVYAAAMCKADYMGSSVPDQQHLALYVKDVLDDTDGGKERVFRHWYSDMIEDGVSIPWDDIL